MNEVKLPETARELFVELAKETKEKNHHWVAYNTARREISQITRTMKIREAQITKEVVAESREAKASALERDADIVIRIGEDEALQSMQKHLDEQLERRDDAEREMELARDNMRFIQRALAVHSSETYAGSV